MDEQDKKFHEVCRTASLYLSGIDHKEWKIDYKSGWYVSLTRSDGISIGIRRNRQKLEISGSYPNGNYCMSEDVAPNKIGSAMTTKPATIARNIHRRLLPFVITKTAEFAEIDKAAVKRKAKQETYCDMMIKASHGERRVCNITHSTEYEVQNKYRTFGDISWRARVRYDFEIDFKEICHLTIDEACAVLRLLKGLQDVRDAKLAERIIHPTEA